ncbi:hypothetical protein Cni_G02719 [Canna indica]|uniref:VQ domain-containing protein n=1 Tax=Canna indica TaxID=4628 RepID=A0AAQ3JQH4_9LILI|nr:hypothetical protein Cni_G02719 [Canna indica]
MGIFYDRNGEADDFTANSADSLSDIFHSSATGATLLPPQASPSSSIQNHGLRFFDPISYLDSISSTAPSWHPSPAPRYLNGANHPSTAAPTISTSSQPVQPHLDPNAPGYLPRSSKKRSRASRQAQTTVLTTDTSNFRAMVQQFTGIPSPPFDIAGASASPFARSHFSLFRSTAAFGSSYSSSLPPPPPLLLRPFPLKTSSAVAASPNMYSSSSTTATTSTAAATNVFKGDPNASVQISSTLSRTNRNQTPMLTLQSLLHDMPSFFSPAKHQITTETPAETGSSNLGLPAPELMVGVRSSWANGSSSSPPEIGGSQQGASSCKMNYLAPGSSDQFNAEKELAAAASKGEDMMESWIFSSD